MSGAAIRLDLESARAFAAALGAGCAAFVAELDGAGPRDAAPAAPAPDGGCPHPASARSDATTCAGPRVDLCADCGAIVPAAPGEEG